MHIDANEFVKYAKEYLDVRGRGKLSKAEMDPNFLRKNRIRLDSLRNSDPTLYAKKCKKLVFYERTGTQISFK